MIKVKHFNLKKCALVISLCLSSSVSVAGSISTQMDNAFNALVNVTEAGAYDTARRGVVSGGQIFIKMPTKRVSLTSATAPRMSAGCGGIDMYGGSFSFINADEMVETFQAIGANALGYGVKIAVTSACPTCEQVMTSLEKTAQAINALNIDSCQAAQGLVAATGLDGATKQADVIAKVKAVGSGLYDDAGNAWDSVNTTETSAANEIKNNDPEEYKKEITGNIAWRAFNQANLKTVFSGDDDFLELIMTITGTVIINNPSGDSEASPKPTVIQGHGVTLTNLINESTGSDAYKVYECDTKEENGCLTPTSPASKVVEDKGLRARVIEALTGDNGYISSLSSDKKMSDENQKVLSLSTPVGALCMNTIYRAMTGSTDNALLANNIATTCSNRMALEAAFAQVLSYFDSAKSALDNAGASESQQAAKKIAQQVFSDSQQAYFDEYLRLSKDLSFADIKSQIESHYSESKNTSTQGVK